MFFWRFLPKWPHFNLPIRRWDPFTVLKMLLLLLAFYESWVVPAGVGSALADILGAEFGQIINFVLERGGVCVIKSIFFFGGV